MPYTPDGKAVMLDGLRGSAPVANRGIATISLHSADPGNTGASELAGGAPAYARKPVAFGAPAAGAMASTGGVITFDVPAGATVMYAGYWSGEGAPKFLGSDQLPTTETFVGQGRYDVDTQTLNLNA